MAPPRHTRPAPSLGLGNAFQALGRLGPAYDAVAGEALGLAGLRADTLNADSSLKALKLCYALLRGRY